MLPERFTERMQQMLGEEYPRFLQSYDREAYHSLRVNTLKGDRETFLRQAQFSLTPVAWEPNGFYYDKDDRPGRHPYHDAGVYYIQEASAMAPVVYLEPQPGERILDLCAAPGGKSTQIAAAMQRQGLLVCNEIHPARAKILSENVERMGIRNAMVTNETPGRLAQAFPEYFHRILVDAPCSGEGMFRKNEEACEEWSPQNVQLCADRQDEILDYAAAMLVPGGRLVYSTCTFAPQEDEGSVARFLKRHPEFEIVPMERFPGMAPGVPEWSGESADRLPYDRAGRDADGERYSGQEGSQFGLARTIRLWPHLLKGEGHFVAVLRKADEDTVERTSCQPGKACRERQVTNAGNGTGHSRIPLEKGIREKDCPEYLKFRQENLDTALNGMLIRFGDQLYLAPEELPSLNKMRVLRPGLHLGTVKKNRFEPAHALALALMPHEVKRTLDLRADSDAIIQYLKGQTLNVEGEKGWYLISVDGYSIGWGKQSGGIVKNHYPKGLRRV